MSKQVVVLGAGMVGTATALALRTRGFDVALVDRHPPGREASYGNAGVIQGEAREPYAMPRNLGSLLRVAVGRDNGIDWDIPGLWRQAGPLLTYWRNSATNRHRIISAHYDRLIRRSVADHARWITASDAGSLISRGGYRLVFRDAAAFERQAATAEQWHLRYGVDFACQSSSQLAAAEPALRKRLAGAIHWQDSWTCSDPGALVTAYADLFVQRGGELIAGDVTRIDAKNSGWRVMLRDVRVEAAHVVIALGAWSVEALEPLGYRVPMVRKRGYHRHFALARTNDGERAPALNAPVIDAAVSAVYAPMRAGLRIATGADLSSSAARVIPRQLQCATRAARELLDLGEPIDRSVWAGVRPCMPDMLPMVGAAPRHHGLWFNFGHGHQGFTLGPTTAWLLAGAMTGDMDPAILPLAPSRWSAM